MVTTPLFIGGIGGPEIIVVFLLVILLFGADKLPKLARASGEAMGEYQKGREKLEAEITGVKEETRRAVVGDDDEDEVDMPADAAAAASTTETRETESTAATDTETSESTTESRDEREFDAEPAD
ncbi:twin-arginine translocase TatA/TatE family subunit [Haloarchaeobius sp. DFWS5]|uniref:twin-arginine translocase TatA/TatE family subunit n=1 Tax=Haloarchaeobius sp. DFWS5 TaxID=3446114 RepID=UPI003EB813E3